MGSLPQDSRRHAVHPLEWLGRLRAGLVAHYRADTRFHHLALRHLRPLWRAARGAVMDCCHSDPQANRFPIGEDRPERLGYRWLAFWCQRGLAPPTLAAYVAGMDDSLRVMGLVHEGQPAEWAATFVHQAVVGQPWTRLLYTDDDFEPMSYSLRLYIYPHEARVWATVGNDWQYKGPGREAIFIPGEVGIAFDRWADLEVEAVAVLRAWFATVRRALEAEFPLRNEASLAQQESDLLPLYRHLFHHASIPDRADRERLRRLARLIEVDFPRRAQKHAPKLA